MDAARENQYEERAEGELVGDRYLLSFWPVPPEPDAIVKQTSEFAAYWHGVAAETRLPISPEQIEEGERLAREVDDRLMHESSILSGWGDRPPTERQRQSLESNILGMVRMDRDLTDAISAATPTTQRGVAWWAARRSLEAAGLAELPWVAAALEALEAGSPLPPPFDYTADERRAAADDWANRDPAHDPFAVMEADDTVVYSSVPAWDGGPLRHSRQHAALPSLFDAADEDPLKAAMNALFAAGVSFGDEYPALLTEVRAAFGQLA